MHPETVFDQILQFRTKTQDLTSYLRVVEDIDRSFPFVHQKRLVALGQQVLATLDTRPWAEETARALEAQLTQAYDSMVVLHDGILPQAWAQLIAHCREALALGRTVARWAVLV